MRISEADVEYVARLANLEVPDNEKKELAEQLSRIVDHVQQLDTLDVAAVPPTYQAVIVARDATRDDRPEARTGSSEAGKTPKLFKVPKVITER